MSISKKTPNRQGVIKVRNGGFSIWEEGLGGAYDERESWERLFKRQVFTRVVQQLNRLGWSLQVPEDDIKAYSRSFALNYREGAKGDLRCYLSLSGRHIELSMWQGVNTPTRPDNGGRYEHDIEAAAPYLMRLEMIRTRNRVTQYLCNIFDGYTMDDSQYEKVGNHKTALDFIKRRQHEGGKSAIPAYAIKSSCGGVIETGKRVYFFDRKGRACTGIAYHNGGGMWWVVCGKYLYHNKDHSDLHLSPPADLRVRRNEGSRRRSLEQELNSAVSAMNFERAAVLRDILFPTKEPLFNVWHKEHGMYHKANFSGYTASQANAGKFTAEECAGWDRSPSEVRPIA